jgi:hypothetical protein
MNSQKTKWSDDAFLDQLRALGDPESDACVHELHRVAGDEDFHAQFAQLTTNDAQMPEGLPPVATEFFEKFHRLPEPDGKPADLQRLRAGQRVFLDNCFQCCMALLLKSVPEGYQAPCLTTILHRTRGLDDHTYVRLLGVLQMVVNVCTVGGFEPKGEAIITANKLRLLHSGIRHIVGRRIPTYHARFGVPVNLEDMLGTIMGFSLLVVEGVQSLECALTEQEAADYYYVWTNFALLMGIHPPGRPADTSFVPQTLSEAREFYQSYARRHYKPAAENPTGVELASHLLAMVKSLLPDTFLKHLGLSQLPRLYMDDLIGREAMLALGQKPVVFFPRFLLHLIPWLLHLFWKEADKLKPLESLHEKLSAHFLHGLIARTYGGEATFLVPERLRNLRELVAAPVPGGPAAGAKPR